MSDYYQCRDETGTPIDYYQLVNDNGELCKEIERLNNIINKVIKYIKEHCIDDEFYINLTNKEKGIIDVLTILQNGVSDSND